MALDTIEKATGEQRGQRHRLLRRRHAAGRRTRAAWRRKATTASARSTFFTTQVDFTYAGDLKVFVDEDQVAAVERSMNEKGYLDGTKMATAFNMLRSGDLIWPYVVNNYMRGKEPLPFDLLYWNADSTRMAAANHSFYLRNCYLENNLSQGRDGARRPHAVARRHHDPGLQPRLASEDHIAPARSVFLGSQYFGGEVEYVMAGSGHIAGVVNPPALEEVPVLDRRQAGRRFRRLGREGDRKSRLLVAALAEMDRREGCNPRGGAQAGQEQKTKVLGDAPGNYVKVRV